MLSFKVVTTGEAAGKVLALVVGDFGLVRTAFEFADWHEALRGLRVYRGAVVKVGVWKGVYDGKPA